MTNDMKETNPPQENQRPQIDEYQMNMVMAQLQSEQNLPLGIVGGLIAALAGASVWAVITAYTNFQIGWMAVGVGFLVGYAVRYLGKGVEKVFGITGALFSLLGCAAGNFFSVILAAANNENISFFSMLFNVDLNAVIEIMVMTFHPMDVLFYGIAVYEGYKIAILPITDDMLARYAMK
ncbi:MAG: hypothetical protein JXR46_12315 [Calditrichaceae bacterium]|nr:hypothetical protein [Calditrichaceae bacterium]MBN2709821.1 hypothetical protein [Calditrichaceae bacterium]